MSNENSPTVHATKDIPASNDTLYKAWTEAEQLKQWWRPMNKQLLSVENDIRKGGRVVYNFEGGLSITGEYKEVEENKKLVYSWNWELPEEAAHKGEYLLTILFQERGDESTLEVTQENFKEEHAIKPHQDGWNDALNALHDFLSKEPVQPQ